MRAAAYVLAEPRRYRRAQRLARGGQGLLARGDTIAWLPGMLGGWTRTRDLPVVPAQTFREWWEARP